MSEREPSFLDDLLSGSPRDWVLAVFGPVVTGLEAMKGDVWMALGVGGVTVMCWVSIAERLDVGGRALRRLGTMAGLLGGGILVADLVRWWVGYLRS
jgi:hypothetical protein